MQHHFLGQKQQKSEILQKSTYAIIPRRRHTKEIWPRIQSSMPYFKRKLSVFPPYILRNFKLWVSCSLKLLLIPTRLFSRSSFTNDNNNDDENNTATLTTTTTTELPMYSEQRLKWIRYFCWHTVLFLFTHLYKGAIANGTISSFDFSWNQIERPSY